MEAPIWMEGPSGPTGMPLPMAMPLASSFTTATRQPIGIGQPRMNNITCTMPEPLAAGSQQLIRPPATAPPSSPSTGNTRPRGIRAASRRRTPFTAAISWP